MPPIRGKKQLVAFIQQPIHFALTVTFFCDTFSSDSFGLLERLFIIFRRLSKIFLFGHTCMPRKSFRGKPNCLISPLDILLSKPAESHEFFLSL